ncbi:hypothetical protein C8R46DRAFT_1032329 [Mycena filopes]|nr:hypothetical protein C8R46DRAFT_1032329 [Mycena filopes]
MDRRGRDRGVSAAARARLHSIERGAHRHSHSRSPSPPSSAESVSPRSPQSREPTPPPTLEDQVHIAYADDDIHLAKVLLLRLQGIEVTSDNDPRIAAVKDEDFDACFIPFGGLDDGRGNLPPINTKQPPVVQPDPARADALRAKELLWESEARRFTEERNRCAALKRRQTDSHRAATLEEERVRLMRQKEAAAAVVDLRRKRMKPTARTLNFALVPPVPAPRPQRFTYDFPFTPRNITPRVPSSSMPQRRATLSAEPRREEQQQQSETRGATRVTFQQVLASMRGELFPDPVTLVRPSGGADRDKARRQRALLDALLVAGVDLNELNGKGKGRERTVPVRCAGCSPSVSLPPAAASSPSSSSGLSRAGSWLSFASSSSSTSSTSTSRSSTSTAPSSWASASTILSSSFSDSPPQPKSPSLRLMANWLPGARRTASPEPQLLAEPFEGHAARCRYAGSPRTLLVVGEPHPLLVPPDSAHSSSSSSAASSSRLRRPPHMQQQQQCTDVEVEAQGMPFTLALTRLATLARNLQTAYVRAVVVGYGVQGGGGGWQQDEEDGAYGYADADVAEEKRGVAPVPRRIPLASRLIVRRAGERAGKGEVKAFLAPPVSSSATPDTPSSSPSPADATAPTDASDDGALDLDLAPTTPLSTLPPSPTSSSRRNPTYTHPPARTALPARLPYALVFSQPLPLPRSPWAAAAEAAVRSAEAASSASTSSAYSAYSGSGAKSGFATTADIADGVDGVEGGAQGEEAEEQQSASYCGAHGRARGRVRARAVPNSAFLRVKALHRGAMAFVGGSGERREYSNNNYEHDERGASGSGPLLLPPAPTTPRRPRECVVGLGVDRAPGSAGGGVGFGSSLRGRWLGSPAASALWVGKGAKAHARS